MTTIKDVDTLARTVYGEARGEPSDGKKAVALVILNRVKANKWYGKTITEVCLKPYQFSCWNENDPNREKLMAIGLDNKFFQECMMATLAVLLGTVPDVTLGATHYHAGTIKPPVWAKGPSITIAGHIFYSEVD